MGSLATPDILRVRFVPQFVADIYAKKPKGPLQQETWRATMHRELDAYFSALPEEVFGSDGKFTEQEETIQGGFVFPHSPSQLRVGYMEDFSALYRQEMDGWTCLRFVQFPTIHVVARAYHGHTKKIVEEGVRHFFVHDSYGADDITAEIVRGEEIHERGLEVLAQYLPDGIEVRTACDYVTGHLNTSILSKRPHLEQGRRMTG